MSQKKYIVLVATIAILFLIVLFTKQYLYGEHRDIATEDASIEITANDLVTKFTTNQKAASKELLDKVITVYGKKTAEASNSIVLEDQVQINLLNTNHISSYKGEVLYLKGRLIGYDELLEMVKIDQATLISK